MIDLDAIRANAADSKRRIGEMCANLRPPKMSIPVSPNDDDEFICRTLDDLLAYVDALRAAARKVTCRTCGGDGSVIALHYIDTTGEYRTRKPCSDCTDLRAILGEQP